MLETAVMLLERMEMLPAAPATVPPPIFTASDLYFGVSLSASASFRERVGAFKYSVLGHGGDFEAKKSRRRCTDPEVGPMARPWYQAAPWAPSRPPWFVSSILLAPGSSRDGKISW